MQRGTERESWGAGGDGPPGPDEASTHAEAKGATPRLRILIVDDDPDFLALAESALAAHGFVVERAPGGLRAVFLATHDVPDAVLCDLRMPGIDGFVVAEALRADPATRHTAIFACTGRRDLGGRASGATAFDGVLVKPLDWDAVARLLMDAIGARQSAARGAA